MDLSRRLGLEVEVGELCPDVQSFLDLVVDVGVGQPLGRRVAADLVRDGLHPPSAAWRKKHNSNSGAHFSKLSVQHFILGT